MPLLRFTQNIQRHLPCPPSHLTGETVQHVLEAYFSTNPLARGYLLDDDGSLRKHMAIFVDGKPLADRKTLSDHVTQNGTVDVMQALSGG